MLRHDCDGELRIPRKHQGTGQAYHARSTRQAYQMIGTRWGGKFTYPSTTTFVVSIFLYEDDPELVAILKWKMLTGNRGHDGAEVSVSGCCVNDDRVSLRDRG